MPNLSTIDHYEATFIASADIAEHLRVYLDSNGQLAVAGATDQAIGYLRQGGAKSGKAATVRLVSAPSAIGIANEAVAVGTALYAGASGKVTDTKPASGKHVGCAGNATTADGQQILVLKTDPLDHT